MGPRTFFAAALIALVLPVGAGQARLADVSITQAAFSATWTQSKVSGSFRFAGQATGAASLTASLISEDGSTPTVSVPISVPNGGPFGGTIRLTPKFLPGFYQFTLSGSENGNDIDDLQQEVELRAPPEGVITRAYMTNRFGGPPLRSMPQGRTHMLVAFFDVFASPKGGRSFRITYFGPHTKVSSFAQNSSGSATSFFKIAKNLFFAKGSWRAVATVNGKVVATARTVLVCPCH